MQSTTTFSAKSFTSFMKRNAEKQIKVLEIAVCSKSTENRNNAVAKSSGAMSEIIPQTSNHQSIVIRERTGPVSRPGHFDQHDIMQCQGNSENALPALRFRRSTNFKTDTNIQIGECLDSQRHQQREGAGQAEGPSPPRHDGWDKGRGVSMQSMLHNESPQYAQRPESNTKSSVILLSLEVSVAKSIAGLIRNKA